ncbi:uncharacterized protein LOC132062466 [Lycium ferocissimum]|uniref:uncharacterized protein LOC132062466 n=1 Tax=Lycium ferocissimum TaxID=112874 RepID=UPI002814E576|nr:uncharacterized protein LOC132062466 [Lycium ferocissimum]XP_059311017.1 uncharacterized protein LOC132062466 [Lycium ferocissimum]
MSDIRVIVRVGRVPLRVRVRRVLPRVEGNNPCLHRVHLILQFHHCILLHMARHQRVKGNQLCLHRVHLFRRFHHCILLHRGRRHFHILYMKKCTWNPIEDHVIRSNFTTKASSWLSNIFSDARTKGQKTRRQDELREELNKYWATSEFQKKSSQTKAAQKSKKGGSLHTCGSVSMGTARRKLKVSLGRPPTRHELWKKAHTKNKDGKEVWIEPRVEHTYNRYNQAMEDLTRSQPTDDQCNPITPSEEHTISCWLDTVGGVNKGKAYGLCSKKNFHRLQCGLQGIGSSATVSNEQLEEMRYELRELARNFEDEQNKRLKEERRRIMLESDVKELKAHVCNLIKLPCSSPLPPSPPRALIMMMERMRRMRSMEMMRIRIIESMERLKWSIRCQLLFLF